MPDALTEADRLWLDVLQQVTSRAAHELKGALNGVSVNLEVVRGRAAQAEQPASAVSRFATSAATQLDLVIDMNEALLALARRAREPMEVGTVVRQLAALLVPVGRAAGRAIDVATDDGDLRGTTSAPGAAVRAVLGSAMLAVLDAGGGRLDVRAVEGVVIVEGAAADGPLVLDARAASCAAASGIAVSAERSAFTLTFPVPAALVAGAGASTHGAA